MRLNTLLLPLLLPTSACSQPQPQTHSENGAAAPAATQTSEPEAAPAPAPANGAHANSSEAAVELVERFAELLNGRKFGEAYLLLGPRGRSPSTFRDDFSRYSNLQVAVGAPAQQEGAAGSVYISVPLTVSGSIQGERTSRTATAIVRRINDVPGSTQAERQWHIERLEWAAR